jgi:hypothetical protein
MMSDASWITKGLTVCFTDQNGTTHLAIVTKRYAVSGSDMRVDLAVVERVGDFYTFPHYSAVEYHDPGFNEAGEQLPSSPNTWRQLSGLDV